ncbi:hypothetical protein DAI22_03g109501 [Oryza sativa Japonica Group]|nr:hypothetical protein DAI22_03g109501 [Oryza sativa Japonica Group]
MLDVYLCCVSLPPSLPPHSKRTAHTHSPPAFPHLATFFPPSPLFCPPTSSAAAHPPVTKSTRTSISAPLSRLSSFPHHHRHRHSIDAR